MSGMTLLALGAVLMPLGAVLYTSGHPAIGGLMLGAAVFAFGMGAYRNLDKNED